MRVDLADALAIKIGKMISGDAELTPPEMLVACMMVICDIVGSIDCRDCRKLAIENYIEKLLPKMLLNAQVEAHQPHSEHRH
jgi:hypothetical protein